MKYKTLELKANEDIVNVIINVYINIHIYHLFSFYCVLENGPENIFFINYIVPQLLSW